MTSQFNIYTSSDLDAPLLTGRTGSLVGLLDACLVTGYGIMTGSGWTHPLVNSRSLACYTPPSGSRMTLFVNDSYSSSVATQQTKESFVTG